MSSQTGEWLLLITLGALGVTAITLRARWQRWWFELEDPRSIALYRIVFTLLLLWDVHGLSPWLELLFTSDGMFTAAGARQAFAGIWGAGDVGVVALARGVLQGPFSILYFRSDPAAFWTVLALFDVCAVLFMIGLWTRVTGVLTLVLVDSILTRNLVFWEGTEVVFRVFLVYLVCARSGHAYSVDAWRRRRRLPAWSDASAPRIPAWPRRLMMVQMAILMVTTGLLKHGDAWLDGDAVYYALTYDHFTRFRVESGLAALGDGALAVLTWTARAAEVWFPLALVGVVGRWSAARHAPLTGRRRVVVTLSLLVALLSSSWLVYATGAPRLLPVASPSLAVGAWVITLAGTWWLWSRARRRPIELGGLRVDAAWLGGRVFGRRIWITAAALLMLGMWSLMNIGPFHPIMLASLIPFFGGRERVAALQRVRRDAPPPPDEPSPAEPRLAYTRRVRGVLGVLIGWHLVAVSAAVLPASEVTSSFRAHLGVVAGPWLSGTRTWQSWGMWAKPPHENVFLKVEVVDAAGARRDLRTDLYAEERRPPSPVGYDRWWKIAERLVKSRPSAPYRDAYARWLCRHVEPAPVTVELIEVSYPIPTPAENRRLGGYDPDAALRQTARERAILSHACDDAGEP